MIVYKLVNRMISRDHPFNQAKCSYDHLERGVKDTRIFAVSSIHCWTRAR